MIKVIRATKKHYQEIVLLHEADKKVPPPASAINSRDLSFVAIAEGRLVGFVWVGLMAEGTIGYFAYFLVSAQFRNLGISNLLVGKAIAVCSKIGVKEVIGVIDNDQWHPMSVSPTTKVAKAHLVSASCSFFRRRF